MDSLTQAVLGASIGGAMLSRFHGRKAVVAGAVLASLPDLDVFMQYADPISSMTHHRGFTHSLFVLTIFSLLLAALWRGIKPDKRYSFGWLCATFWLIFITHPLLDSFTSFGTQLWWPLMPTPASWSSLFIIDPLYTVPLLIGSLAVLIFGAGPRTQKWITWGLIISSIYLAWSVGAKHWAEHRALAQLQAQGINTEQHWSAAMPFNTVLWRMLTRDEHQHCEMVISLLDRGPSEYVCVDHNRFLTQAIPPSDLIERLRWFTGDWVRFDLEDGLLIATDVRIGAVMGVSSFRFVVAEQGFDNEWYLVTPYRWPGAPRWELLKPMMRRVLHADPPLPLDQWLERANMGKIQHD